MAARPYRFNFALNETHAERNKEIISMRIEGMSQQAIADRFGLTQAAVWRVLRNGGFATTPLSVKSSR